MEHASLQDRSVVIIGGTTGLGLSAAKACVRAGARVVVCGRNPESAASAEQALGSAARVLVGDATDPGTADSGDSPGARRLRPIRRAVPRRGRQRSASRRRSARTR